MKQIEIPSCDDRPVWDVWMSMYYGPSLLVADELGLFSLINKKPATAVEVAAGLSLGSRATEALLGLMTSLGFLVQHAGKFHLTNVTRNFLLPESTYYWGGMLQFFRAIPVTHTTVREALEKDKPVAYEGKDLWETHEVDPQMARAFTAAMHSHILGSAMGVALRGDFTGVKRVLDVAGGSGCFCIALALRHPDMSFTVADLPVVCRLAEEYIAEYGLQDRITTTGLNMFKDKWPKGYDAVFFSNIFHDWNQKSNEHLAAKSFEALPSGGSIYLHEALLEDTKDGPRTTTAFSVNMLVFTEGKQYTAGEFIDLLQKQGFVDITITPTFGYYSLIRGRKP